MKQKLKSAASTTGSAIKKGGSTVAKGAKKVGGWFGGWIRWIIYAIIAMAIILVIAFNRVKPKGKKIEEESIIELFIKDQITSVEYIRNKIVVAFKDSSKFNPESLKDFGATGINIIGDKIKFYFDNDQTTKKVYDNLKKHISIYLALFIILINLNY